MSKDGKWMKINIEYYQSHSLSQHNDYIDEYKNIVSNSEEIPKKNKKERKMGERMKEVND